MIGLDSVSVGDKKIYYTKGIVDTGTSAIVGPKYLIDPIIKDLPSKTLCGSLGSLPNLIFTIGGYDYVLTPNDYYLRVSTYGIPYC